MTGKIDGISGPTVRAAMKGLRLYERVFVGENRLTGEVVRLEQDSAVIQVYEDARGLAVGEPVKGTGQQLSLRLGPGLLSGMFDGLQRPLERLREKSGPFIRRGEEVASLDGSRRWTFTPSVERGDDATPGDVIGYVDEGPFRHIVSVAPDVGGRISGIAGGSFSLEEAVGKYEDGREIKLFHEWPARKPRPYRRKLAVGKPLLTGQRCIDFLFPLAKGGTAIFPGGFGTGKTILEQSVAKFADVDVVVYVGCGERGNEMAEMIEEFSALKDPWTGRRLMERTILVVNTSNMPVAAREASIYTAVSIAEYYRDMGCHVLLLADSLSRWAEALREISSSLEEMPGEEGYPTYLASRLSGFLERAGVVETLGGRVGSLSMILSVSPPGGDFTEPVTQACLRTTGAFLMLDTSLAHKRHFPAINWTQSYSLYTKETSGFFREEVSSDWELLQQTCRQVLQEEQSLREVAEIVGSEGLQDKDRITMMVAEMVRGDFLAQNAYSEDAFSPPDKTCELIRKILGSYREALERLKEPAPAEELVGGNGPPVNNEATKVDAKE